MEELDGDGRPPFLSRVFSKLRQEGPLYTAQLFLMRLPAWLLHVNAFVIYGAPPAARPASSETPKGLRLATAEDLALLGQSGRPVEALAQRFSEGYVASILERDGRLLGHAWFAPRRVSSDHVLLLEGRPGDVWAMDGWVDPRFRRRGIYNQIKAMGAAACARRGAKRVLSHVDLLNRNSRRANLAFGGRELGRGAIVTVFGFSLVKFGPGWFFGRFSSSRPLLLSFDPADAPR